VLEASLAPSRLVADTATTAIVVALIAALGSVVATIVGQVLSRKAERDLADRTRALEDQVDEARRDYIYQARKRLYEECEPVLFQTVELVETARDQIASLARSSRLGDLRPDGSGWLAEHGYYFTSSVFQLLAPMTSFKIVQRRLTALDLRLEPRIREQYELLKLLFLSFTRDFDLALCAPALAYHPDRAASGEPERDLLLREEPGVYSRQGLFRGNVEVAIDALIRTVGHSAADSKSGAVERCKTFGEFLAEFDEPGSPVSGILPDLDELFAGFHPGRKPVLWRVLVAQVLLYDAFLGVESDPAELEPLLDCGNNAEKASTTLEAARAYVEPELTRIRGIVPTSR
jgi:hypothetical protein